MVGPHNRALNDIRYEYFNKWTILIEYSAGNPIYVGMSGPGTATSAALWQIQRLTYSGSDMVAREWANSDNDFKYVWDNRASYSYG